MPFGNPKTYTNHSGVDFPQSGGTPIYASGNGTVARHSKSPSGGHWIVINYDGIGEVGYAHMNDWRGCPAPRSRVKEGTLIGYVGWDGHVVPAGRAGAHVHVAKISNQTYAATIALFDTSRVVRRGTTAGTPSKPATQAPIVPEEDDMLMLKITAGKKKHLAALGPGIFKHFAKGEPYEKIMKVSRARDDWQTIDISELPAFLRTYGCDEKIWDFRNSAGKPVSINDPDQQFVVLDPLTGKVAGGNTWTAAGAIRAALKAA